MLLIIFSGLTILPLLFICFGGLFLRSYMSRKTIVTGMVLGSIALGIELYRFYQLTHSQIELRQWLLISDLMAIFPVYASLTVIILGLFAFLIFEGLKTSKITAASVAALLIAVLAIRVTAFNGQTAELAANNELISSPMTVDEMKAIIDKGSVKEKIILATREDLTLEIIQKLIQDPSEIIRFYGLVNPAIDLNNLEILKTSDQSTEIRKQAAIEIKKRKTQ